MIAGLGAYPKMRDSGVAWLGDVPDHWRVERGVALVQPRFAKNVGLTEKQVLSLSYGRIIIKPEEKLRGLVPESFETYQHVFPNDIIVRATDLQNDKTSLRVAIARDRGIITSAYLRLAARDGINPDYAYRLLHGYDLMKVLYGYGSGLRQNLEEADFKQMPVPIPSPDEQAAIVRFLDSADQRIRRSIVAKQRMIRLLEEQKAAIVHQAVARGLNPDVPMKPSDVEWIGDIPAHWDVVQVRRLAQPGRRITYGIVQPGEPDPLGRFMVRGQDYSFGWGEPDTLFRVSDAIEAPYQRSRLLAGDLVYTIVGAGVGNVAEVPRWLEGANITQTSARISVDPRKAEPSFVRYSLESPIGRRAVDYYVKGAAQPGLNLEHLRVFPIPLPPLEEQRDILRYLENTGTEVGPAVRAAKREIELLGEYRARLVADVVTGKLDVRMVAAALSNLEPETLDPNDHLALDEEAEADSIVAEELA